MLEVLFKFTVITMLVVLFKLEVLFTFMVLKNYDNDIYILLLIYVLTIFY